VAHSHLVIGLNSGTSADGIDAVLVRITGIGIETRIKQLAFATIPYPAGLRDFVLKNSLPGSSSVDIICRLNALLAHLFADAAKKVAKKANVPLAKVDLIGSHGQTVHHLPREERFFGKRIRSTLQLGDPSMIAALTGVATIGNFRPIDMALGGQGAPLVPFFDYVMFRSERTNRLLLNIGGIANITVIPKNGTIHDVRAFDTGPGNIVIDALMKELLGTPFDRGGRTASSGWIESNLLAWMMQHAYFQQRPPKSTGREEFGLSFVREIIQRSRTHAAADVIATATAFTALSIYEQYARFVRKRVRVDEIFVSGGGVHNRTLMENIQRHFEAVPVRPVERVGFSSDAKEAVLFALLAHETLHGAPTNVPEVTGAAHQAVLGVFAQG
jgi:anhydro-N-acetylmuramic acid kinase